MIRVLELIVLAELQMRAAHHEDAEWVLREAAVPALAEVSKKGEQASEHHGQAFIELYHILIC
eukprot:4585817-Karenia_brevis.AAC.1